MTAPTKSRGRRTPATRQRATNRNAVELEPGTTTAQPDAAPRRASRGRTSAAERAYARRAQRADLLSQRAPRPAPRPDAKKPERRKLKLSWPKSRASFVLAMMGLLAVGVATTLWLTTQAIADSYRLEQLRTTNASLAEAKAKLQRDVAKAESPGSLAPAAQQGGLVPSGDPARIIVGPDGKTTLVGEPKKAQDAPPAAQSVPPAAPAGGPPRGARTEGDLTAPPAETPAEQGGH
ncbi:hypothetical protein ACFWX6_11765 [Amycolatopsis sp. NPDC059019]|uniref:hypothetical protein n=1 Tax=unclassified Amycolatopsis TaxID=2618356 RepID=UPI00366B7BEA